MRSSGDNLMSVGEVSRALGITRRIILNYEDKGLIEADVKDGFTGNRYYTTDTLTRIRTIRVFRTSDCRLSKLNHILTAAPISRP